MIVYYDQMNFINVLSMRYTMPVENVAEAQKDFLKRVGKITTKLRGQVFYTFEGGLSTTLNDIEKEWVTIRFFVSVEEDAPKLTEGMQFDSYFSLGYPVCCCRLLKNEVASVAEGLREIGLFCEREGWRPYTSVYYQVGLDDKNPYLLIKVGICESLPTEFQNTMASVT